MSLRVWLPLNGDLTNNGLSDVVVTNNGATVDNAGKIGKCYYLSGSPNFINTGYSTNIGTNDFSIALWIKIPTITTGTYYAICSSKTAGAASVGFGIYWNYSQKKFLWSTADGSGATEIWMVTAVDSIVYDKWIHLVMIRNNSDPKKGYFYINGVRYELASVPAIRNIATAPYTLALGKCWSNSYYLKAYYNDFRIYDHALSAKEVKLLSQGLVCHYKLSDVTIQQMNNCYVYPTFNTSAITGGWYHWGLSGHIGTYGQNTDKQYIYNKENMYSHWVADDEEATQDYLVYQSPAFEGGYRSLVCILKEENGTKIDETIIYPAWNSDDPSSGVAQHKWTSIQYLHDGFYLCKVDGFKQTGSNDLVGMYITKGHKVYLSECYLENDRQVSSDIFYNTNIIYDSSGYNNHMTAVGAPIASTDSIRNIYSTHFTNTQYAIANENSNTGWLPTEALTVNLWMYCTTWNNPISCTEGGGWNFENSSSIRFPVYIRGVGYKTANSGVQSSTLLNDWHMLTGVFTGTEVKIYIDNELKGNISTGSTNGISYAANRLCIAAEAQGQSPASTAYVGDISDVRIYATALSEEDIQELYNAPVSVANTGAMLTQGEFVEVAT